MQRQVRPRPKVINRERPQHLPGPRCDRRRPARPQSVRHGHRIPGGPCPARFRHQVRRNDLPVRVRRHRARTGIRADRLANDGGDEAGAQVRRSPVFETGAGAIDQDDTAITAGRRAFHQTAQRVQDRRHRIASRNHFEQAFFARKQRLGSLAVVDIGGDSAPFDDPAECVRHRIGAEKEPAVCPVEAPQARLLLAGPAGRDNELPAFQEPGRIVRVHRIQPPAAAGVPVPALIDEIDPPVRRRGPYQSGQRIDEAAEAVLHTGPFRTPECAVRRTAVHHTLVSASGRADTKVSPIPSSNGSPRRFLA